MKLSTNECACLVASNRSNQIESYEFVRKRSGPESAECVGQRGRLICVDSVWRLSAPTKSSDQSTFTCYRGLTRACAGPRLVAPGVNVIGGETRITTPSIGRMFVSTQLSREKTPRRLLSLLRSLVGDPCHDRNNAGSREMRLNRRKQSGSSRRVSGQSSKDPG